MGLLGSDGSEGSVGAVVVGVVSLSSFWLFVQAHKPASIINASSNAISFFMVIFLHFPLVGFFLLIKYHFLPQIASVDLFSRFPVYFWRKNCYNAIT